MPSDISGHECVDGAETGERRFEFQSAPFRQSHSVDEVNRAAPKTQSGVLEAMQERNVTIGSRAYAVAAAVLRHCDRESIEMTGTYPLPEAQLDRFLFKLKVEFPSATKPDRDPDPHHHDVGTDSPSTLPMAKR